MQERGYVHRLLHGLFLWKWEFNVCDRYILSLFLLNASRPFSIIQSRYWDIQIQYVFFWQSLSCVPVGFFFCLIDHLHLTALLLTASKHLCDPNHILHLRWICWSIVQFHIPKSFWVTLQSFLVVAFIWLFSWKLIQSWSPLASFYLLHSWQFCNSCDDSRPDRHICKIVIMSWNVTLGPNDVDVRAGWDLVQALL